MRMGKLSGIISGAEGGNAANRSLSNSFLKASGGPVSCSGKKQGKEPGKGGSPLAILPRQRETAQDRTLDCRSCVRTRAYQLGPRRCRCTPRFVPTFEGASQGATVEAPCRSCPKRGGNCPIAAHEVKRRPLVFGRALDGVVGFATRAGFQRAGPFGCSCILLAGQKYAPGGNKETSTNSVFL